MISSSGRALALHPAQRHSTHTFPPAIANRVRHVARHLLHARHHRLPAAHTPRAPAHPASVLQRVQSRSQPACVRRMGGLALSLPGAARLPRGSSHARAAQQTGTAPWCRLWAASRVSWGPPGDGDAAGHGRYGACDPLSGHRLCAIGMCSERGQAPHAP